MGVYSKGNSYGINEDIIYSFPITCENGEWKEVPGLKISDFSRERMSLTEKELLGEKAAIADLL
jgi:malate dehydrogenase